MKIVKFGVERWMDLYETSCKYNLAETCVESLKVEELLKMAGKTDSFKDELLPLKLTYGEIKGSEKLRRHIAKLYKKQNEGNVITTHGAIGANALVYSALVEQGDHVIAVMPTYQQHQAIPESIGAKVDVLQLKYENNFLPDINELKKLIKHNTKLIALNNPNNPTGSLISKELLSEIVEIARVCGAYILCDEVYRGLDEHGNGFTESIVDIYEKGISTGSMSKTYSLAGLRLGWIVTGVDGLLEDIITHRDYNTISISMIDDYFACMAFDAIKKILERSHAITRKNRKILDDWVNSEPRISYIKPLSGTTALLKYHTDMPSFDFCVKLVESTGVMLTPGVVLGMEGYLRIGYANNEDVLRTGLKLLSEFLCNEG